jgi:REP element-mobilizing transposase RayT/CheY-like chemotaxis protein
MEIPVLVITPSPGFGTLIQQTLDSSDQYRVVLTDSGADAIHQALNTSFPITIIDSDINDILLTDLCETLRKHNQGIRIVLVPPDNYATSPLANSISPDDLLNKPFFPLELVNTLTGVMRRNTTTQSPEQSASPTRSVNLKRNDRSEITPSQAEPAWLQDVSRAAQYLTRLTLESAAQAALILKGQELWAYAGGLPQPAEQELEGLFASYLAHDRGSDLARFVRLETNGKEYLLYATRLGGNMVLGLVFDTETPFSKIRSQAGRLARALASPPSNDEQMTVAALQPNQVKTAQEPEGLQLDEAESAPLFEDVPPPSLAGWQTLSQSDGVESQPMHTNNKGQPGPLDLPPTHPSLNPSEAFQNSGFQPISSALTMLSYTFVVIPRMSHHHLTGDLAARLSEWMVWLAQAFDWHMEHLSIRPDYVLWSLRAEPEIAPATIILQVRQQTTKRIYDEFTQIEKDNPSGDFWAPGYLVASGLQSLTVPVINEFIRRIRQRQGVGSLE